MTSTHNISRTHDPVQRPPADAARLERLVRAAAAGDQTALTGLVERFDARVRAVARQHRLSAHDIEDVMQTTWLRFLQHVDKIREPHAVGAWLETTARRESVRVLRAHTRERPTDDELVLDAAVAPMEEQRLGASERRMAVAVALAQLPGQQRQLMSMLFSEPGPSYAEISRTLGMPIGSIGPTRARVLARLRKDEALAAWPDTVGSFA
jgi:RNA polymerase sigma factor (sigma-70 family)